ncbi:MAG: methyltransferase regulatory domain-containing protein, partial [Aureliella sp.]
MAELQVDERTEQQTEESVYSYDAIPYPSHPFEATHPDHIYTMARLFQVEAPLPDKASILELGCASGGNIIPLAVQLPDARIVGVDLSGKQIADGQATIDRLGLKNIRLIAQDFQGVDDSFGQFDYILCHGVFSWVPPSAQQRILQICRERLSPNGVAYVSYNAYPGWFMRGMIREMMLHHIKHVPDPKGKIAQARAFLAFLVASTEDQDTPYAKILKGELDLLAKHPDAYLFHEHLEENNRPVFFYEFMEMAKEQNLQFLGESSLSSMITSNLPPKTAEALTKLTSDVYHRSQYTDFVTNRMFRQTLLCHKEVKVNRHIDQNRLAGGHYGASFRLDDNAQGQNLMPDVEIAFKCSNGRQIKTKNSALKALVFALADAWPRSLTLAEICAEVEKRLSGVVVVGNREQYSIAPLAAANLLQLYVRGDIEFRFPPDRFTTELSERPMVSPLTRLQAKSTPTLTT